MVWRIVVEWPSAAGEVEFAAVELAEEAFTSDALAGATSAAAVLKDAVLDKAVLGKDVAAEGVVSSDVFRAPCCPFIRIRTSTADCGATDSVSGRSAEVVEPAWAVLVSVPLEAGIVTGLRIGTVTTGAATAAGVAADGDSVFDCEAAGLVRLPRTASDIEPSALSAACAASESAAGTSSDCMKLATEFRSRFDFETAALVTAAFAVATGAAGGVTEVSGASGSAASSDCASA